MVSFIFKELLQITSKHLSRASSQKCGTAPLAKTANHAVVAKSLNGLLSLFQGLRSEIVSMWFGQTSDRGKQCTIDCFDIVTSKSSLLSLVLILGLYSQDSSSTTFIAFFPISFASIATLTG